jgi:hypothetical protein
MKLFEFKDWTLNVREECWGLSPFNKILKRDKSKGKELALKEMLFIYFYTDIKSDYLIISNLKDREEEIKKDINLPKDWKIDEVIKEAVIFYESRSLTVISKLYKNSLKAANDISEYLTLTDELLKERDGNGKPVNDISKITMAITKVKGIMQDLKAAEKEVLKEQQELEGRTKGSKTMSIFEEGLNFEE